MVLRLSMPRRIGLRFERARQVGNSPLFRPWPGAPATALSAPGETLPNSGHGDPEGRCPVPAPGPEEHRGWPRAAIANPGRGAATAPDLATARGWRLAEGSGGVQAW
jgi:hypothetical protein